MTKCEECNFVIIDELNGFHSDKIKKQFCELGRFFVDNCSKAPVCCPLREADDDTE